MPAKQGGKPGGGRRPRMAVQKARETILQAAEEEFAAAGFGGARADRIAARANVNKALPFYYFGSKAELYSEVLKQAMERVARLGVSAANGSGAPLPRERLAHFVGNMFELMAGDRNLMRLMVREMMENGARSREFTRQYFKPMVELAKLRLLNDMDAGLVVKTDPVQILISVCAEVFFYFVLAPVLEGMGLEDPLSPEKLAARRKAVLELVWRGFRGPSAIKPPQ